VLYCFDSIPEDFHSECVRSLVDLFVEILISLRQLDVVLSFNLKKGQVSGPHLILSAMRC
jgi:hypothetical protein